MKLYWLSPVTSLFSKSLSIVSSKICFMTWSVLTQHRDEFDQPEFPELVAVFLFSVTEHYWLRLTTIIRKGKKKKSRIICFQSKLFGVIHFLLTCIVAEPRFTKMLGSLGKKPLNYAYIESKPFKGILNHNQLNNCRVCHSKYFWQVIIAFNYSQWSIIIYWVCPLKFGINQHLVPLLGS